MRQHYIPQFILRNFVNENNEVKFSSNDDKKSKIAKVENVFQECDMYEDENFQKNLIESSLSDFECKIAPLFKKLNETKEKFVWLKIEEYYSLMIFLRLLFFRSKDFKDGAMKNKIEWHKSLLGLSKCRTFDDIENSQEILEGFKVPLMEEMKWYYIVLAERLGNDEYIISSAYPAGLEILRMPVLYFYPISPTRIIILARRKIPLELETHLPIRKDILKGAGLFNGRLKLPIGKMCGKDVRYVNELVKEYGRHGYVSSLTKS